MKTQVKVVKVTKKLVDSLLAKNERNRPIKKDHVAMLVRSIKAGRWRLNGDPIVIDGNGYLMDGQHRLTAFKEADYPSEIEILLVKLPVVGEERDRVYLTLNTSRPYSGAQMFKYMEDARARSK